MLHAEVVPIVELALVVIIAVTVIPGAVVEFALQVVLQRSVLI